MAWPTRGASDSGAKQLFWKLKGLTFISDCLPVAVAHLCAGALCSCRKLAVPCCLQWERRRVSARSLMKLELARFKASSAGDHGAAAKSTLALSGCRSIWNGTPAQTAKTQSSLIWASAIHHDCMAASCHQQQPLLSCCLCT